MPTQKRKKPSKREKIKDQSCESNSGEGELEYTRTTLVPLVALKVLRALRALKALLKTTRNTAHKKGQTQGMPLQNINRELVILSKAKNLNQLSTLTPLRGIEPWLHSL